MPFKIRIAIALFLVFVSFNAMSQDHKIDSLKSLLPEKEGIDKAKVLYGLGRQYLRMDQNIAAIQASFEGYEIAKKLNDSLMIIENGRVVAIALRLHGEVDSAIGFFERILPLSRKYEYSVPHLSILNHLALAYTYTAKYDKALELHFQYLEGNRHNHNISGETIALNNIGLVYYKLKVYRKAKEFFSKTIFLKKKINDDYDLGPAFINLGLCDAYLGDYGNAKINVLKGIQVSRNNSSDYEIACGDFAMGVVCFGLKEYHNAERYFLKSYRLAKKENDQRFQFDNIDYLTQIYLMQNRISDASYCLSKAEEIIDAGAPYNLEMIKIYTRFFQMYNRTKNYEKVALYQQKYIQLKDSVYNEEFTINLMRVEADYHERENQAKIIAQEQVLRLKEEIINGQRILNIVASVLVLIVIAFTIMLWRNYTRKRKVNIMLDEKVKARTAELELSRNVLITTITNRNILLDRAVSDVKEALTTMQGLCVTGLKDIADPIARQYMQQMVRTSDYMAAGLQSLFRIKDRIVNNHVQE